jgi:hypothetical protein
MSVEVATKKRCPKCKEVDKTTFSKCRNCGTRYDAVPQMEQKPINLGLPIVLCVTFVFVGYFTYQYIGIQNINNMYSHLDKLVGKSVKCQSEYAIVSTNEQDLRALDAELAEAQKNDPKHYGSKGLAGIMSAASALDSLSNQKEGSSSVISRYMEGGRIAFVDTNSQSVLSVEIVGATSGSEKFPLVHVKLLNGPRAGSVWWMNADQLDLENGQ